MSIERDYISELLPPTDLLFIPQMIDEFREQRWNNIDRMKPNNLEKNLSSDTLSTTNPT
jgi:hypothetical protein